MIYKLPANNLYGNTPVELKIPDNWDVTICDYKGADAKSLSYDEIKDAILHPLGRQPIAEAAKGKKDAIIIIDDISRPTPDEQIAKILIAELEKAGVPRDKIRFLCAIGSHRAMSREDFVHKLGEEIVSEFYCYSHNPFFNNVSLGESSFGTPVEMNADAVAADFKIAIGNIVPHGNVGIAGGGKTILPGIASMASIQGLHSLKTARWDMEAPGQKLVREATKMLGLDFKVDVLLNGEGDICKVYAGDIEEMVPKHLEEIQDFYKTPFTRNSDIVLANNYFKPSEPILALSFNGLLFNTKEGGALIVAANTPQGSAPHYNLGKWGDADGTEGPLFRKNKIPSRVGTYYAFSTFQDKASAQGYHFWGDQLKWVNKWEQILADMGDEPKTITIYPHASVAFFGETGNIGRE